MSVSSLIRKHGVTVTRLVRGNTVEATGFVRPGFSGELTSFTAFVQPQSATEGERAGAEELTVTHKVFAETTKSFDSGDRLSVVDGSVTLELEIVGIHNPGLFKSGRLAVLVLDCVENAERAT